MITRVKRVNLLKVRRMLIGLLLGADMRVVWAPWTELEREARRKLSGLEMLTKEQDQAFRAAAEAPTNEQKRQILRRQKRILIPQEESVSSQGAVLDSFNPQNEPMAYSKKRSSHRRKKHHEHIPQYSGTANYGCPLHRWRQATAEPQVHSWIVPCCTKNYLDMAPQHVGRVQSSKQQANPSPFPSDPLDVFITSRMFLTLFTHFLIPYLFIFILWSYPVTIM